MTAPSRAAVSGLRADAAVTFVEPDRIVSADVIPNDPQWNQLWGMRQIHAPQAWNSGTGSSSVIVAVLDTGVDYTHLDLAANMWTNHGEIPGNGMDDDGNGWVDDVHGIDCLHNDGDPMDDNGHGTHVAGTIGAVGNNAIGVTGVNWTVQIMALKFLNKNGIGSTSDAARCLDYAIEMGAQIVNDSWGGPQRSAALARAFDRSEAAGQLEVVAAGNDGIDNDRQPSYPANFPNANLIAVAATTPQDKLASFSNYGATRVDLAAPGTHIRSTVPTALFPSGYAAASGTSMASPHVAGAAALLLSQHPGLRATRLKAVLLAGTNRVKALKGQLLTGGRLNVAAALQELSQPEVSAPVELPARHGVLNGSHVPLSVRWGARDRDGIHAYLAEVNHQGRVGFTALELRRRTSRSTGFSGRTGTRYRFRVKAIDRFGIQSPWATAAPFGITVQDDHWPKIDYRGPWVRRGDRLARGRSVHAASRAGARAVVSIPAGTRAIGILGLRGPREGKAQILLDGHPIGTIDLYAAHPVERTIVFARRLGGGAHTVELHVLGTRNPHSAGTRVILDAIVRTVA